jgi:NAD(P)-dependent dehydrogenase (short-subunit alcohol dehydrogenase family)
MSARLDGKVAVITGGASGMGKATVLRFLAEGAKVVAADINDVNGKGLLEEAAALGFEGKLRFATADVSAETDVEAMIADAVDSFGGVDVVFNNAGFGGAFGPLTEIDVDHWDATFAVLCRGVFLGIKHGARAMQKAGSGGSIINTASVAGLSGGAGPHAYSAAKAAVINMTRAAAIELAASHVRVNAICPGAILTPLIMRGADEQQAAIRLDGAQPWPEHGTGDDIAGAALFLASEDSRFVTGEALVVDGGLTAAGPRLFGRMQGDAPSPMAGMSGISYGSTGKQPVVRPLN